MKSMVRPRGGVVTQRIANPVHRQQNQQLNLKNDREQVLNTCAVCKTLSLSLFTGWQFGGEPKCQ